MFYVAFDGSLRKQHKKQRKWWESNERRKTVEQGQENTM
jgi:hypothetical protein